jgi:hypothetical protein
VLVSLALSGERMRRVAAVFQPVGGALDALLERYTDAQLRTVLDFVERSRALVEQEAVRLRAASEEG